MGHTVYHRGDGSITAVVEGDHPAHGHEDVVLTHLLNGERILHTYADEIDSPEAALAVAVRGRVEDCGDHGRVMIGPASSGVAGQPSVDLASVKALIDKALADQATAFAGKVEAAVTAALQKVGKRKADAADDGKGGAS